MFGWFRQRKRKKLLAQPSPESWSLHLNRNVRLSWRLSDKEKKDLAARIKIFSHEKRWEGCEGLEITEEMRVTISAQACLMLLGVEDFYFDNVPAILVYPGSFQRKGSRFSTDPSMQSPSHRSGEAWQGGPIVLSWQDALRGGRDEDDGHNVVIHEFAHALDGLDGEMGGSIMFDDPELSEQWSRVLDREFHFLKEAKQQLRRTLLDHYGATNRAEFFAVASETFFERPHRMRREHEELYHLLESYYHVDPTGWQAPDRN